jgi:hypothetical protein
MAFKSQDGKQFSMASRMRAHNKGIKSQGLGKKLPGAVLEAPTEHDESTEHTDPSEVRNQHGPAHELHIEHREEEGQHHVHSKHESGYEHHSAHSTKAEAHDAARELAGADEAPDAEPEGDGEGEYLPGIDEAE